MITPLRGELTVKRMISFKTAVSALILLSLSTVLAQTPLPFAADFSSVSEGDPPLTGKFFFSLPNTRMDMSARGRAMSVIVNGNTKMAYMVNHTQRVYLEMKPDQIDLLGQSLPQIESSFDPKNPCSVSTGSTCKDLGPDTVNGRLCEKWQITPKDDSVKTIWVDQKLHFPIKSQTADGSGVELSNVQEGAQPASLFDPPAGYRKTDLGDMMRGRKPQSR
jgi:outer membrane lipoprotein-sorting protein